MAKSYSLCEIWKREFDVNIVGLTVADGKAFVTTHASDLYCLNEKNGSELWNYSVNGRIFQPTIANGVVLFGASDGNFYALNVTDSTLKWKFETGYKNPKGKLKFAVAKTANDQVFMGWMGAQIGL